MKPPALHMVGNQVRIHRLLFLCTGNYYRSRFAEQVFNMRAAATTLPWLATSAGLALERGVKNVGPIAPSVVEALRTRLIVVPEPLRFPIQVQEPDLAAADLIIALCEAEHRAILAQRFPGWLDRVEYWQVDDLHLTPVTEAFAAIEREVTALLERLRYV